MKNLRVCKASNFSWGRLIKSPALLASLIVLLFSVSALAPPNASAVVTASYPDITGTWTGTGNGQDSSCTPTSLDGFFADQLTVTFSNQNGNNFDVSVVRVEQDGFTSTDTGSGFFTSQTQIQLTITSSSFGSVDTTSITADISGSTISFTFNGSNVGGDGCVSTGNGTLSRSGGNLSQLNPATEASSTITNAVLFNTQLATVTTSLGTHIGNALRGGPKGFRVNTAGLGYEAKVGLNAGAQTLPFGIWGNYTYTNFENDLSSTAFDGHSHSLLGGIDFAPFKNTVLGVALGYGFSDVDTTFNSGNQTNDTYTIAPYFGAVINDTWSLDASIGFSRVNIDQFRTTAATRITSSPIADRWFGSINLNGVTYYNNWVLGGRVGVLRANNDQRGFAESNGVLTPAISNRLGTISIGGDVAYSYGNFEPFTSLTYENDYQFEKIAVITGPQPANDRDNFLFGAGVRYYGLNGLSGSLEWNRRLGRANFDEDVFNFSLRMDF